MSVHAIYIAYTWLYTLYTCLGMVYLGSYQEHGISLHDISTALRYTSLYCPCNRDVLCYHTGIGHSVHRDFRHGQSQSLTDHLGKARPGW